VDKWNVVGNFLRRAKKPTRWLRARVRLLAVALSESQTLSKSPWGPG